MVFTTCEHLPKNRLQMYPKWMAAEKCIDCGRKLTPFNRNQTRPDSCQDCMLHSLLFENQNNNANQSEDLSTGELPWELQENSDEQGVIENELHHNPPSISQSQKFCTECGTKIEKSAKFCSSCGHKLGTDIVQTKKISNETPGEFKDETIRRNLKEFSETSSVNCLECGYSGMAGVTRTIRNSSLNWSLMLGGVGMLFFSFVMGLGGYNYGAIAAFLIIWGAWGQFASTGDRKIYVKCPNCLQELGPIKA